MKLSLLLLLWSILSVAAQLGDPGFVAALTTSTTAAAPTSPAAGYYGWYKADTGLTNESNVFPSDGDTVKSWVNQGSGGGYQVSAATYPIYKANIKNGQPVVRFANASSKGFYASTVTGSDNVPGLTIFVVFSPTATASAARWVVTYTINGSSTLSRSSIFFGIPTANKIGYGTRRLDADSADVDAGSTLTAGSWYIACAVLDYSNATKTLYLNGNQDHQDLSFQTAGNTSNTTSDRFGIGGDAGTSNTLTGDIAEVLIYQSALSTTDRQTTESYLNAKYLVY